jgi:hypothetical protein
MLRLLLAISAAALTALVANNGWAGLTHKEHEEVRKVATDVLTAIAHRDRHRMLSFLADPGQYSDDGRYWDLYEY